MKAATPRLDSCPKQDNELSLSGTIKSLLFYACHDVTGESSVGDVKFSISKKTRAGKVYQVATEQSLEKNTVVKWLGCTPIIRRSTAGLHELLLLEKVLKKHHLFFKHLHPCL